MFISVTRLHLKGKRKLPSFFLHTLKSTLQLKKASGLHSSSFSKEGWTTFWTLTVWENKDMMRNYRNAGHHLEAMKVSRKLADELEYIHWESENIPAWDDCKRKLHAEYGRV
jgi:heme-degrading monooxygenase HmoA